MKQTIRLKESELRHMISESVKRVLNEIGDTEKFHDMLGMSDGYNRYMGNTQKSNRAYGLSTQLQKNQNNGQLYNPKSEESAAIYRRNTRAYQSGFSRGWDKAKAEKEKLKSQVAESVRRVLNEVSGWSLEKDDVTWVNDAESGASDKAWMVRLWPGSGYYLPAFGAYASSEEDALEKVVAYLDKEGDDSFFCDDYVEEMKEVLTQEGKDEEEIWEEIDERFCYVDATMDGGGCHYVFWENLAVYPYDEKRFR